MKMNGMFDPLKNQAELEKGIPSITKKFNKILLDYDDKKALLHCGILFEYNRYTARKAAGVETGFSTEWISDYLFELFGYRTGLEEYAYRLLQTAKPVLSILSDYKKAVFEFCKERLSVIHHVSEVPELKELRASTYKLNQYKNEYVDAVFGSMLSISAYIYVLRCAAGGMWGFPEKNTYIFSSDPFIGTKDNNLLKLAKPVYIYSCSIDSFEPVIDFVPYSSETIALKKLNNSGFHINFGDEWISRNKKVPCIGKADTINMVFSNFPSDLNLFYFAGNPPAKPESYLDIFTNYRVRSISRC